MITCKYRYNTQSRSYHTIFDYTTWYLWPYIQNTYTPYNFCFYTVLFALALYLRGKEGLKNLLSDTDSQIINRAMKAVKVFSLHNWFSAISRCLVVMQSKAAKSLYIKLLIPYHS